jgi:hypothetical protein
VSQLSLFGTAGRAPRLTDLDGLLAGTGHGVRRGAEARISVVVREPWRAAALAGELAGQLSLDADLASGQAGTTVRTPWLTELYPVVEGWMRGAVKLPPAGWSLDGPRLRWWCVADGRAADGMYTLALGASDSQSWLAVGSALAVAGIPGVLVGPRADGPAYRIVGRRRLARLAELVGDPPPDMPAEAWPSTASHTIDRA